MSDEIAVKNIKKFDGTNFQTWKFLMNTVFVAYDAKDLIDGERKRPAENEQNARKAWDKDNAKAMFIISSSIEDKHLECLLTCTTAKDMWTMMITIHEQKSESSKLILTQKFHQYKMDVSDSVVQHFAKVQNMARQLEDVGEKISDVAVMAKILASLPSKYNSLITAWDSVEVENQTLNNLQLRLLKEESRLNAEEEMASALAATTVSQPCKSNNQKLEDVKHRKKTDRKPRTTFKCHYCKKPGHFAKEYRKKKRDEEAENNNTSKCAFVATTHDQSAHEKKFLSMDVSDVWLMDSGTSRHIIYHRKWFDVFTPIENDIYISRR